MNTTSTRRGRATRAPAAGPYDGPRRLHVGQALLPPQYAKHADWPAIAAAMGRDLLLLRRSAPHLFRAVAHTIAEAASELRRQQRHRKRYSHLYEGMCPDPGSETAIAARLRLREAIDLAVEEGELSLLELLAAGHTYREIGWRLKAPVSEVGRRVRALRLELKRAG